MLTETLQKLSNDKVKMRVIHSGVGAINESDVLLASASNAIIIGFNVRPERNAAALAEQEKVDIRLHTIIYNLTDEIKRAMTGLLEPVFKEVYRGKAEVRETFRITKVGTVAGCMVQDGTITRDSPKCGCCATTWWCTPARSARCGASRTTSAKSRAAWSAASRWRTSATSSRATSSRRSSPSGSPPKCSPETMAAIGVLTLELRLENSHSLKDKRHVVQSLKDRLRNKFNVAVAEIDYQDLWQRAAVAAVTVSARPRARREGAAVGGRRSRRAAGLGTGGRHGGVAGVESQASDQSAMLRSCLILRMDERRTLRVSEAVREELTEIIGFEMEDPRLLAVEVTEVQVSPDGRHATSGWRCAATSASSSQALAALEHAAALPAARTGQPAAASGMSRNCISSATGTRMSTSRIELLLKRAKKSRGRDEN